MSPDIAIFKPWYAIQSTGSEKLILCVNIDEVGTIQIKDALSPFQRSFWFNDMKEKMPKEFNDINICNQRILWNQWYFN